MFAKSVTESDEFLELSKNAQCLYFHLAMNADDDGFINAPKKIIKYLGCDETDMDILIDKNFIILFDNGIATIRHWKVHNYIQKDRYRPTSHTQEKAQLILESNNIYQETDEIINEPNIIRKSANDLRKQAYAESELPYSFDYKIRHAFVGEKCPICNGTMDYKCTTSEPTIQHNIPISKGGKHELGNISVICRHCNTSIQNDITDNLNAQKVIDVWDNLCIHR